MLGPPSFARGLRTLIFGYGFNQILDEVKFPEALQTLTFGDGFKKSASISGDVSEAHALWCCGTSIVWICSDSLIVLEKICA